MADQDQDVLLGRLAVHYKILDKARVSEALQLWRSVAGATGQSFDAFLVSESYVAPDVMPKLLRAREQYLQRQGGDAEPEGETPPPTAPPPAAPPPAAPVPQVGAETVRLKIPDMTAPVHETVNLGALETETLGEPETETLPPPDGAVAAPVAPQAPPPAAAAPPPTPPAVVPSAPTPTPTPAPTPPAAAPAAPSASAVEVQGTLLEYRPGIDLPDLLRQTREKNASDLHVHSGAPLKLRLLGELHDASTLVPREEAERLIFGLLSDEQRAVLKDRLQIDFSYSIPGVGRFRANAYYQHRGLDAVFRAIPPNPPTLAELGMPEDIGRFADFHQGIVLFTGPAGCGKSSTMAAIVEMLNRSRPDHILTIEDPIEYVFTPAECVVNQREVGPHTESFARALRGALREDPDVIVIGELRDHETISLALTAAETGHLVLGTLHTSNTVRTINRILGVFPPQEQAQIATMFSETLRAVVSQRLLPLADGTGRIPALEILVNNKAIGNLIRDRRTFQIKSALQTGGTQGMCLLDASLKALVKEGRITQEAARREADDPKKFA